MSSLRLHNAWRGFTIIELLVVLAIIGILATVATVSFSETSASARDAQRQADLKNLQNAIETYRSQNGRYPAGCNSVGNWSGQLGTNYECSIALGANASMAGTGQYIVGLAPEYISVLPIDPKLNGTDSGYIYRTNAEGTVYKLKAHRTVETEVVTYLHPLKACDIRVAPNPSGNPNLAPTDPRRRGWCGYTYDGVGFNTPVECNSFQEAYNKSYALWGGLAPLIDIPDPAPGAPNKMDMYAADPLLIIPGVNETAKNLNRNRSIKNTTDVICK